MKVPHIPTSKGDQTRAERSARREALLSVAAQRMGIESWSTVESSFRKAVETASTDAGAQLRLISLLEDLLHAARCHISDHTTHTPPKDVAEAMQAHPKRRKIAPASEQ